MADRRRCSFVVNPLIYRLPPIFGPTRPLFLATHYNAMRQKDKEGSLSGSAAQSDAVDLSGQPVTQGPLPIPAPAADSSGASIAGNASGPAFETQNSAAHRAGNVVLDGCGNHAEAFRECLENYGRSSTTKCQFLRDAWNDCRGNPRSVAGV